VSRWAASNTLDFGLQSSNIVFIELNLLNRYWIKKI